MDAIWLGTGLIFLTRSLLRKLLQGPELLDSGAVNRYIDLHIAGIIEEVFLYIMHHINQG